MTSKSILHVPCPQCLHCMHCHLLSLPLLYGKRHYNYKPLHVICVCLADKNKYTEWISTALMEEHSTIHMSAVMVMLEATLHSDG